MSSNLKDKILRSGLIDKHTASVLERWGHLQPGDADKVKEDALKDATQTQLTKLADEIEALIEKEHKIRETNLDLRSMRWPTQVVIHKVDVVNGKNMHTPITDTIQAMIDSFGRLYFRAQDIRRKDTLAPGHMVRRLDFEPSTMVAINEVSELYLGNQLAAYQVSIY